MKLEKAKEILSDKLKHPYANTRLAYPDALKLAIEALKRIQYFRSLEFAESTELLPGETEK